MFSSKTGAPRSGARDHGGSGAEDGAGGARTGSAPDAPGARRGPVAFVVRLVIFAIILAGVGEVWFRVVTPACETPNYVNEAEWKIMRYDTAGPREGLWTVGRLAARGGEWRVNNDGWISAVDYTPGAGRDRFLVALLGDSYIEAFLTDANDHVDTYLAERLGGGAEAYAFAMSAWYLEQYVAAARYVSAVYEPDVLVVFLGDDDVAQSVRDSGPAYADMWQIMSTCRGFSEIPPSDLSSLGRLKSALKLSATASYLLYNAKIRLPGEAEAKPEETGDPAPAGADAGTAGGGTEAAGGRASGTGMSGADAGLLEAARFMVGTLRSDNPGTPIVFVARGDRYLPVDLVAQTPLDSDAAMVREACAGVPDCYFLDLRPAFSLDWAANHQTFESADGAHWNAYANRLVARAVATFLEDNRLTPGGSPAVSAQ